VACGEHGDHSRKLVNAIENGKRDIRTEADFDKIKASNGKNGDAKVRKFARRSWSYVGFSSRLNDSRFT
jgi:hypothetical protein